MYDVAIIIKPGSELSKVENTSINFHMAYINPEFTMYQLYFRIVFTAISLLFLCYYCTKVLCRVPKDLEPQLSFEQRGTLALTFLLFLFNDPLYMAHVYSPSFLTYALTELSSALFISGMLMFWLRELADMRPSKPDPKWGCFKKCVFGCHGYNKCARIYLALFFLVMVSCFMVLNCTYYIHVKGDPSLAGRFDRNNEGEVDFYLWPIIVTLGLLVCYYSQFIIACGMGCNRVRDKKIPTARKVSYFTGHIIHFFFIFCVLFGVFSRHFRNGGFQLFAYSVVNLYIYMLVIVHWPVKVYFIEHDTIDNEAGAAVSDA